MEVATMLQATFAVDGRLPRGDPEANTYMPRTRSSDGLCPVRQRWPWPPLGPNVKKGGGSYL